LLDFVPWGETTATWRLESWPDRPDIKVKTVALKNVLLRVLRFGDDRYLTLTAQPAWVLRENELADESAPFRERRSKTTEQLLEEDLTILIGPKFWELYDAGSPLLQALMRDGVVEWEYVTEE
jgi:hypothetical protein